MGAGAHESRWLRRICAQRFCTGWVLSGGLECGLRIRFGQNTAHPGWVRILAMRNIITGHLNSLPSSPGVYALLLALHKTQTIRVGRLGQAVFPAGEYVYLGSARGPGGLRARLGRHVRGDTSRPHWHVDFLRSVSYVLGACYLVLEVDRPGHQVRRDEQLIPLECTWSQALASSPTVTTPLPHFGASDCRSGCLAHLVAFPRNFSGKSTPVPLISPSLLTGCLAETSNTPAQEFVCHSLNGFHIPSWQLR